MDTSTSGTATNPNSAASPDPFIDALKTRLLASGGAVSSEDTPLEKNITAALESIKTASGASGKRIESQFGREIQDAAELGQARETSFLESGRGFATNTAALRQLREDNEKSLRDLESRKQEALLMNDSAAASQIFNLQMKKLELQQDAEDKYYSRVFGLAQFAQQERSFQEQIKQNAQQNTLEQNKLELDKDRQEFYEKSTVADRALKQMEINIKLREVKMQEAKAKNDIAALKPDAGFGTLEVQNAVGSLANSALADIAKRTKKGLISEDEADAELLTRYAQIRRQFSKSQVSDEAILETLGMRAADNPEDSKKDFMFSTDNPFSAMGGLLGDSAFRTQTTTPMTTKTSGASKKSQDDLSAFFKALKS